MTSGFMSWFHKFFKDSGLGTRDYEGVRNVVFKKDSMTYCYKVKGKFFEEDSTKVWMMVDGIHRNYGMVYGYIRNKTTFSNLWKLNWGMKDLVKLEISLIGADTMYLTLETDITLNEFKIYIKDDKEICEEVETTG